MSISLQGPSGSSGDLTSTISIIEGVSEITTFTATNFVETVDWSLANGDDQDLFSINKSSGELILKMHLILRALQILIRIMII